MNEGLHRKLTLISAQAGFGKTTLVSEWVTGCERPYAWLSLDEGDNDPTRFITYLIAALQTIAPKIGEGVLGVLQSLQPPPIESIVPLLVNEISAVPDPFVLVLDDYHVIESDMTNHVLAFLIEHLPPQAHLVIATRKKPHLPLPRLRVRGQLTELRGSDLRFTLSEVAGFLNQAMALNLATEEIAQLASRTEGWIAGLQLAAISLQGHTDAASFINSFSGNHHYVLDYLVEEVLHRQSEDVQHFLLRTSILDRMSGPLCDALLAKADRHQENERQSSSALASVSGQANLEYLEQANLFIVPLDDERRWYRYHHLFAELLRQRLQQRIDSSLGAEETDLDALHLRASEWFEDNGLEMEAFHHAVAANAVDRAARLIEGEGMPLIFRGAATSVRNWLESLPTKVLDAKPSLWVTYAVALLFGSQISGVESKLQAAEAALKDVKADETTRDLVGHMASIRATIAVTQHQVETILVQSHRALEYLHPDNLPVRTATTWTLGYAYHLQGDRASAMRAYSEAISISGRIGHFIVLIMATIGLGNIQETDNQLELAAESYLRVLELAGDPPLLVASEAHLGLARIGYERNDLEFSKKHAQRSAQLARIIENTDRFIASDVLLSRLMLAEGNVAGAAALLAKADQHARSHNFVSLIPTIAAARTLILLRQGHPAEAARMARTNELPLSLARVQLAQGDASKALAILDQARRQAEARGWEDERLKALVLEALALRVLGQKSKALRRLSEALAMAEPSGFVRIFVDEGIRMEKLLSEAASQGIMPVYTGRLLAVFEADNRLREPESDALSKVRPLIEPLSRRELDILQLIAEGLSNREISERLFLALSTVKGHIQNIFGKLQVQRRTEAIVRARELELL
ncbi:LuxR C-terminal-related transcriptional regulator [Cohnella herbarum]|nr:LuxR C-terminal-related transcriptional regulator [Cohnella herbarum]